MTLVREASAASLRLRAGTDGKPLIQEMHSSGALAFRRTEWGVWMVSTAAHPIAGDTLRIRIAVGADCRAEIRSLSATVARKGPAGTAAPSSTGIAVRIGAGGSLVWSPEPGVAAEGAHHQTEARVRLASGARLAWHDEWVLGRHGEEPGTWRSRIRITMSGRPILASELASGPGAEGWASRAVLARARAFSTLCLVDPGRFSRAAAPSSTASLGTATGVGLPVSDQAVQLTAWGENLLDCRMTIDQLVKLL
jgi:urease accessory protein